MNFDNVMMNGPLVLGNVLFLRIYMIVVQIIYPVYIIFCMAPINISAMLLEWFWGRLSGINK